jgi:hypothetical protein
LPAGPADEKRACFCAALPTGTRDEKKVPFFARPHRRARSMKKVTTAASLITISHYKNILTSEGISAFIRNEHLASIIGEMPFQEVWPELWVRNDLDYDRALQLIDSAAMAAESPTAPWLCRHCEAENEGQFAACWSCGEALPQE